jgi:hypothetical protein
MELLREELAGPSPTPLERLLVERVVACWLQVQDADVRYAQAKSLSLEWSKHHQQRMDRAHKRYLSAIKALTLVRKLALPVLQVNIARKQVNVAGVVSDPMPEKRSAHEEQRNAGLHSVTQAGPDAPPAERHGPAGDREDR